MSDETATAGEATTATSAGDQNTVVADWRTEISEPGLRRVAEKFTSPAEVVKSYAALQSRLGRSVVKPGPDAAPEEIAAYRRQPGRRSAGRRVGKAGVRACRYRWSPYP